MRTALFRNREAIVEADEADLVRDVCLDIDKAQAKLARIKERLKTVQGEVEFLTMADTKLTAAIVAALLSPREKSRTAGQRSSSRRSTSWPTCLARRTFLAKSWTPSARPRWLSNACSTPVS